MILSAVPGDHHTTTAKLLAEAASTDLGDYLPGPWAQEYIEGDSEEPAYYRVTTPDGTVVATLPDWAGQVALFLAVARDAMPVLLTERNELLILAERLRAQLADYTHPVAACFGCHHPAPWHVGELGSTERACTQHACGCTNLTREN